MSDVWLEKDNHIVIGIDKKVCMYCQASLDI